MEIYCTYNNDFKDLVLIHPDNGIIDGRTLILDEDDTMLQSGHFSVAKDEIVCKFLNGTLDDENCKSVNYKKIKEIVDSTLLLDATKLNSLERYRNLLNATTSNTNDTFRAKNVYYMADDKLAFATTYAFPSYESFLIFILQIMIKNNCRIYRCKNCGRYFIPKRSDAYYCNNIAPYDERRTCMQKVNYENSLKAQKDDLEKKLHRQIYNALRNNVERNPDINGNKEKLENFIQESADFREDIKNGNKTKDDYVQWLINFKRK